jgi:hypothetical protein
MGICTPPRGLEYMGSNPVGWGVSRTSSLKGRVRCTLTSSFLVAVEAPNALSLRALTTRTTAEPPSPSPSAAASPDPSPAPVLRALPLSLRTRFLNPPPVIAAASTGAAGSSPMSLALGVCRTRSMGKRPAPSKGLEQQVRTERRTHHNLTERLVWSTPRASSDRLATEDEMLAWRRQRALCAGVPY